MKLSKLIPLLVAIFWLNTTFGQTNLTYSKSIETLMQSLTNPINETDVFIKKHDLTILPSELAELKSLNKRHGHATISKVGKEQAHQFFLMVLQCNQDVHFQLLVLKQMEKELSRGEVSRQDFAILKDRIHLNKNLPQLFGTQYIVEKGTNQPKLFHVKDSELLEKRRMAMNLTDLPDVNSLSELLYANKN